MNHEEWEAVTEHSEQAAVIRWARTAALVYPGIDLLHAIPNGTPARSGWRTGRWMAAEGARRGVPDLCLPVPLHGKAGLYVEMKSATGRLTEDQRWWHARLREVGHVVLVCRSATEAIEGIERYYKGRTECPNH